MPAITEENDILKTILFSFNVFVHMLVGIMMGVPMLYAVLQNFQTDEADSEAIMHHILICVPAVSFYCYNLHQNFTSNKLIVHA